jgi:DNA polymerase III epsilon subunit-like protein
MSSAKYLLFDFETSDLYNKKLPPTHLNQAWPVQVGALYLDKDLNILSAIDEYVAPPHADAFISQGAYDTHGIGIETCQASGISHSAMCDIFSSLLNGQARAIGHNVWFDLQFVGRYAKKLIESSNLETARKTHICTMKSTTAFCKLPPTEKMKKWGLKYKAPKLEELYNLLFGKEMAGAHNALADCKATHACLIELINLGIISL